jgi:hypothetical protein
MLPKIVPVPKKWEKRFGRGTIAIAHPLHMEALIRTVRKGRLVTQLQIRKRLARKYGADHLCPLTTGIFLRIISEAAEEDRVSGKEKVTPYWRVVRDDGSLNERFPGGAVAQMRRLRAEGHTLKPAAKNNWRVQELSRRLANI